MFRMRVRCLCVCYAILLCLFTVASGDGPLPSEDAGAGEAAPAEAEAGGAGADGAAGGAGEAPGPEAEEWGDCSRTCGGGVARRTASACSSGNDDRCEEVTRYKVCNIQPCPRGEKRHLFRQQQCARFNGSPYRGSPGPHRWRAVHSSRRPCALLCAPADHSFIAQLAAHVTDGTPCRPRSRDMCVNGTCWSVGCDLELNSGLEVDACGVCGGDGTSCTGNSNNGNGSNNIPDGGTGASNAVSPDASERVAWRRKSVGECSVTCGKGHRKVQHQCEDKSTGVPLEDEHCAALREKPEPHEACARPACLIPVWISGPWRECSHSCGGGVMGRFVYCMSRLANGSFVELPSDTCTGRRLISEKPCNTHACPSWHAGQWSACSATCDVGVQRREVVCRSTEHYDCSPGNKPPTRRRCRAKQPCGVPEAENNTRVFRTRQELRSDRTGAELYGGGRVSEGRADVMESGRHSKELSIDLPAARTLTPQGSQEGNTILKPEAQGEDWLKKDAGSRQLSSGSGEGTEVFRFGDESGATTQNILVQQQHMLAEPHYETSDWSSCSTTCGAGTRSRRVTCQTLLPPSNIAQYMPDSECRENKPADTEPCVQVECPPVTQPRGGDTSDPTATAPPPPLGNHISDYEWVFSRWGDCSVPCLGGLSHAELECIRIADKSPVKDVYCAAVQTPSIEPTACNQHDCEPTWRTHGFGPCSAICGGGHQTRRVVCVQETRRDPPDSRVLPDERCRPPIPPRLLLCNLKDCPASWETSPWSQCSVTCGPGVQTRLVFCQQVVTPGKVVNVTEEESCPTTRPEDTRPCDVYIPCATETMHVGVTPTPHPPTHHHPHPEIEVDQSDFVQLKQKRKISVSVGGSATVIPGTNVVVKCPVQKYDQKYIHWKRKENEIAKKGRIKVSKKGYLQIRKSKPRDSDTYECMVVMDDNHVMSKANISIKFHSNYEGDEQLQWRKQYMMDMHQNGAAHHAHPNHPHHDRKKMAEFNHNANALHKGSKDRLLLDSLMGEQLNYSLPYMFISTRWSPCTKTCGGAGYQMRNISCELVTEDYYRVVNESLCSELGQEKPIETRDCGFSRCPVWMIGQWSECSGVSCFTKGVGTMVRPTYCILPNGSETAHAACDKQGRPYSHQPCPHPGCVAGWTTSDWSPCSKMCGGEGTRTRILKCVWKGNTLPAGAHCRGLPRPKTVMACDAPPCHKMKCRDKSKYCNLVPMMKLCRYKMYKHKCCASCKNAAVSLKLLHRKG